MKVFGVSFDSVEDNAAFAAKQHFPFPLLCDTQRELGLAFGACLDAGDGYAARFTFVVGPGGVIEQALATADPAGQADALLAALS